MNGQYEFKVSRLQLIALTILAEHTMPGGGPMESMTKLIHTMVACTVDLATGEYVDDKTFGMQLVQEPFSELVEWMDAFMEYVRTHVQGFDNGSDRLAPFEDFLRGLDDS
jgi:hypothetical protein